jgi:hypothetical protein
MIDGMMILPNNPVVIMQREIAMGRGPTPPAPPAVNPAALATARRTSSTDLSGLAPLGIGIGVAGIALAGALLVMRNSA